VDLPPITPILLGGKALKESFPQGFFIKATCDYHLLPNADPASLPAALSALAFMTAQAVLALAPRH
jgi:hypothetical protein